VVLSGTPASSTTKTGCHDIAEILLKVVLSTINQIIVSAPWGCFDEGYFTVKLNQVL
jgi:hypothetical protein